MRQQQQMEGEHRKTDERTRMRARQESKRSQEMKKYRAAINANLVCIYMNCTVDEGCSWR
ncbi:MAG: hypothetical protein BYD32DRAFT_411795 [Podila humilis]|nr:MAG: hypothetical protein BYD32DRAFT_411795 [Podila humilis]